MTLTLHACEHVLAWKREGKLLQVLISLQIQDQLWCVVVFSRKSFHAAQNWMIRPGSGKSEWESFVESTLKGAETQIHRHLQCKEYVAISFNFATMTATDQAN